jgi:hypothetical protein
MRFYASTIDYEGPISRGPFYPELVKKYPREARVLLGVSGKARESQYLGV